MKLEDLPVIDESSDLHVEIVYLRGINLPFLRWLKLSCKTQGYLTSNIAGGTPKKLFCYGQRVSGGGHSHPCYVHLEDIVNIRKL